MESGFFITIEGVEGSGKTTHCEKICSYLEKKGSEVTRVHEPGGTKIGEEIRRILLSSGNEEMVDRTELFLFMASRAQLVEKVIRPAINSGKIVVADRYTDSTVAYQGYGRGVDEKFVALLNRFATANLKPDFTIILDVETPVGLKRVKKRLGGKKLDRIEKGRLSFHQRVRQGYLALARAEPERVRVVDAYTDIKKTEIAIRKHLDGFLNRVRFKKTLS